MKGPRELAIRLRAVMGIHRVGRLEERVAEIGSAAAENARLDALLEPRVTALEQAVAQAAQRRLPGV